MPTAKPDPIEVLIAQINGSNNHHLAAGINGNLPDGWQIGQLRAYRTFEPPGVGVNVDAISMDRSKMGVLSQTMVGAKVQIDPPGDMLAMADDMARQLTAKIRKLMPPVVRIALDDGAIMPTRGSAGASGYDLYAPTDVLIRRGQVVVVHSGVRAEVPDDTWEIQVRPRSIMSKRGMWVSFGSVDSDYRGIIGATVINLSNEDQTIKRGERYAQLVISRVAHPSIEVVEVSALTPTERGDGDGGFGSSGR